MTPMMYGNGLPKEFSGLRIGINENIRQVVKDQSNKMHSIEGNYVDQQVSQTTRPISTRKQSKSHLLMPILECQMAFTRATLKIHSSLVEGTTLEIKKHGEDEWQRCFLIEGAKLESSLFTVYSSFTGVGRSNWHTIHSIKFYDLESAI